MNAYAYWQAALKGTAPNAIVDEPQAGFWRMKRNGGWVPVAVWPIKPSGLGFKIGTEVVDRATGTERWHWFCAHPITEDTYRAVAERGENWPDADPTVAAILEKPRAVRSPGVPNAAADAEMEKAFAPSKEVEKINIDPTAEFSEQIDVALGGVPSYKKIESDEADVRALSLRNMLNDLAATADKAREAEKAPHLQAERDVDARWMPLIKKAREGAGAVKAARDVWATDKMKAHQQAAKRAQEAADEAMVAGRPPAPTPPSNLPEPSQQVRPAYGRASSTGTKMVVTAVDYDKFFAALKLRPEWPTVKAQFDEWAQKLVNKGIISDGVTAEEKANTR